jgi:hypothetical protein
VADDDYLDEQHVLVKLITEAIYDTREIVGTDVSKTEAAIFAHAALNALRSSGFRIAREVGEWKADLRR